MFNLFLSLVERYFVNIWAFAQLAGAVEYTDCISSEG